MLPSSVLLLLLLLVFSTECKLKENLPPDADLRIGVTHRPEKCERKSKSGDTLSMHYVGKLVDGKIFDSSRNRDAPFSFVLGAKRVIKGWEQGLVNMCVGEKRILTIPSGLGYGSTGQGSIPPDATLIFEVELLSIDNPESEL